MKKVYLLLVLGILLAVSLIVGMSYAYWSNTHSQSGENFVESKCFSTSFSDVDGSEINLTNSYPMVDVDGMKTKPYEFTITNTCDTYASYNINLDILNSTTLETSLLKVALGNVTPSIVADHELTSASVQNATSYILLQDGLGKGESKSYKFRMWIDESGTIDNAQSKVVNAKIVVVAAADTEPSLASNYVESLLSTNLNTMNNSDPDGNVRYMGANPNNYVYFNDELWRIIGVFNVKKDTNSESEKRLKLVKATPMGNYSWDSSESSVNNGYGVNEWSQSAVMNLLNNGPYWNNTSGTCYVNSKKTLAPCDFSNNGLMDTAKNFIDDAVWNLGTTASYSTSADGLASNWYHYERGNYVISNPTDGIVRSTTWSGVVGLPYLSDYGYATSGGETVNRDTCLAKELRNWGSEGYSDCVTGNWLAYSNSYWTIVPGGVYARDVFFVSWGVTTRYAHDAISVFPTLYLKSNVKIVGGDGSTLKPYTIGI